MERLNNSSNKTEHSKKLFKKGVDKRKKVWYTIKVIWLDGQVAKTPTFHVGNMGSIPIRAT